MRENLNDLFRRQHGVISRQQANECGIYRQLISYRLQTGEWSKIAPNVFRNNAVPVTSKQRMLGICLTRPGDILISHLCAAQLHGLSIWEPTELQIICRPTTRVRLKGVKVHYSLWTPNDKNILDGIPVTSIARTIVDCAQYATNRQMSVLIDRALRENRTSVQRLIEEYEALGPRRGQKRFKPFTEAMRLRVPGSEKTESFLETSVLRTIRTARLPAPEAQVEVMIRNQRYRLDFAYVAKKIAIEVDGYEVHSTRSSFDKDRRRDNDLRLAGWRVFHFTSQSGEEHIVTTLRSALNG